MFCKNCGTQTPDNARFCSVCGEEQVSEAVEESINRNPLYEEEKNRLASQILTWGILSLAFATTFWFSLIGFIFSFVAKNKVKEYVNKFGPVSYRSRVGRDLGTAGFIVGLILTILSAIYFIVIFMLILASLMPM